MKRPWRSPLASIDTVTATEAKNGFGSVLDRAMSRGAVAITKRRRTAAVLLSFDEYEALLGGHEDSLQELRSDFEELVARMQTPQAKAAGRRLFEAAPAELGRAAVARRKPRRG